MDVSSSLDSCDALAQCISSAVYLSRSVGLVRAAAAVCYRALCLFLYLFLPSLSLFVATRVKKKKKKRLLESQAVAKKGILYLSLYIMLRSLQDHGPIRPGSTIPTLDRGRSKWSSLRAAGTKGTTHEALMQELNEIESADDVAEACLRHGKARREHR